jgi:AcrR family transcriptional regulator
MNRREASKSETRRLILAAAKRLFKEKGVEQCTMRGIAKAAGVSPASVVVHFKNKTALLETALYEEIERTVARAVASLPARADLLDLLLHVPQAMFTFYAGNRELYRTLIRNTVFEPEADSPHLTRQMAQYLRFIALLIEDEKKLGKVDRNVDIETAAASLASLYIGVLIMFSRNPEMTPQAALNMLAAATGQFLTGITSEKEVP